MATKQDFIKLLKEKNPQIGVGDDESGYTYLDDAAYNAQIEAWADVMLAEQDSAQAVQSAKASAEAKLAALGLTTDDLKALGL